MSSKSSALHLLAHLAVLSGTLGCSARLNAEAPHDPQQNQNLLPLSHSAANGVQETQSTSTHIAVLGDSQSTGQYGQRLYELIRYTSKQKLSYFGAASSGRISGWVKGGFYPIPINAYYGCDAQADSHSCTPSSQTGKKTESIHSILTRHPYINLYIITLGDNHFFDPNSVKNELPQLIKPILNSGARCAFVTPTEGLGQFSNKITLIKNLKSAVDSVQQDIGKTCTFIDSYTVGKDVLRNQSDLQLMRDSVAKDPMKLHPSGFGARHWAERVFERLKSLGLVNPL